MKQKFALMFNVVKSKIDALKTDWRSVFPDREQNEVAGPEMSRQQGEAADLLLGLRV